MTTLINNTELREISLGRYVQGKTSTIVAGGGTHQLFTVAGGEVLITALWGKVTTAITLAGQTLKLAVDPTSGATVDVSTVSADIGTTDTAAGNLITGLLDVDGTTNLPIVSVGANQPFTFVCPTGEIELEVNDGAGTEDGVIEWYCTWVPLTTGATVAAAA